MGSLQASTAKTKNKKTVYTEVWVATSTLQFNNTIASPLLLHFLTLQLHYYQYPILSQPAVGRSRGEWEGHNSAATSDRQVWMIFLDVA